MILYSLFRTRPSCGSSKIAVSPSSVEVTFADSLLRQDKSKGRTRREEALRIEAGQNKESFQFIGTPISSLFPPLPPPPPDLTHLGLHVLGKILADLMVIPRSSACLSALLVLFFFVTFLDSIENTLSKFQSIKVGSVESCKVGRWMETESGRGGKEGRKEGRKG